MDTKKACIIAFLGFILAIAAYSLAQFDFTNKLSPPPTACTNFTFLQSFGGNSTICNTVPLQGVLTYYFTNQTSNNTFSPSKRMLTAPDSANEVNITYPFVVDGADFQNWTTKQGLPSISFIPSGIYAIHIHASVDKPDFVMIFAEVWEVNNTGVPLGLIGTTEHEFLTSSMETEYDMNFFKNSTWFMNSTQSRLQVQFFAHVVQDAPSVTLYFDGLTNARLSLPSVTVDASNFLPYIGATQDVNLGTHNLTVNNITSPDLINLENNITTINNTLTSEKVNKTGDIIPGNLTFTDSNGIDGGLRFKVGNFTRDASLASGTQSITGLPFKPSYISFNAVNHTGTNGISWGFDDNISHVSVANSYNAVANTWEWDSTYSIFMVYSNANFYEGNVSSFDPSGFTLNWKKTGTTGGTIRVIYTAYR